MRANDALRRQIMRQFPNLPEQFSITGQPSRKYNCVALALGPEQCWWSNREEHRWDENNRGEGIESLIETLAAHGFRLAAEEDTHSPGTRLAIYARDGRWTHVAVRKSGAHWMSKLGSNALIRHPNARDLEGESYGTVHCFMDRHP